MWIDEKLGICLSLVPGITLWIFTIVCLRKKVNKEEFLWSIPCQVDNKKKND